MQWTERMEKYAEAEGRLRSLVDGFASWTHYARGEHRQAWTLRRRALEMGRACGDPDALAGAYFSFLIVSGPPGIEHERVAVAKESLQVSHIGARPAAQANVYFSRGALFLNAGLLAEAQTEFRELDLYAQRVGDPFVALWGAVGQCVLAAMEGEIERAATDLERWAAQSEALGIGDFGRQQHAWSTLIAYVDLGRYDDALAHQDALRLLERGEGMIAYALACAGREDEARDLLHRVFAERDVGGDENWNAADSLVWLLSAANRLEDAERAGTIARLLEPVKDWYCMERASTVARQLGLTALLLGEGAQARDYFTQALALADRIENRPERAHTRLALARTLYEHYPDERVEAGGT
jgi:tetratricopeptide (TPR) repeat protein